uniref:Integrase core domain-containing protein n=2 Tax=Candidatus Kentrum sp. SD TaxID=2126332 RepID=A0A451BSQ3_9GAMM|nr:MAG: Integrase core domain-containing protein [Candidatus Kentron sp. SD]
MNDDQIKTIEQVREFLTGISSVRFSPCSKEGCYKWIEGILIRFGYRSRTKTEKGLLLDFMEKVSGYSRIQIKRLVKKYLKTGRIKRRQRAPKGFTRRYTQEDIRLLARTDEIHGDLSGPAIKKICERAWRVFQDAGYERLAGISVSHLYNLRRSGTYRNIRAHFDKTRPKASKIGERRKPNPQGKPGYLRVDTVHQGDLDGIKGVYYINAVDEVTQYEILCSVERISERYLIPVLEMQITQFPFVILGFHTDNGSEYINKRVAGLLNKLLIELTKSRARRSNDNALVESKNGSIVLDQPSQSLSEPSSALLLSRDQNRFQGQAAKELSVRKNDGSLRKTKVFARSRGLSQTGRHLRRTRYNRLWYQ